MIYTIIFAVIINLFYTISSISKLKTNHLRITNTFCKRISSVEYKIQANNHTNVALNNLKAFCKEEVQSDPIYFALNILKRVKKENRYIRVTFSLCSIW